MVKYSRFSTLPSEIPLTKQKKVQNKRTKKMAEKTTANKKLNMLPKNENLRQETSDSAQQRKLKTKWQKKRIIQSR